MLSALPAPACRGTARRRRRDHMAWIWPSPPAALQPSSNRLGEEPHMIEDPSRLVIRAKFPRLREAQLAPFRDRTTSFVVDAMNGRGALDHAIKPLDPRQPVRRHGADRTRRRTRQPRSAGSARPDRAGRCPGRRDPGLHRHRDARRQHGEDRPAAGRGRGRDRRHGARRRRDRRARAAMLLPGDHAELGVPERARRGRAAARYGRGRGRCRRSGHGRSRRRGDRAARSHSP